VSGVFVTTNGGVSAFQLPRLDFVQFVGEFYDVIPFTNNLHCGVSLAGVARDGIALVALNLGLTVMYDFINLSCNIATAPFP